MFALDTLFCARYHSNPIVTIVLAYNLISLSVPCFSAKDRQVDIQLTGNQVILCFQNVSLSII